MITFPHVFLQSPSYKIIFMSISSVRINQLRLYRQISNITIGCLFSIVKLSTQSPKLSGHIFLQSFVLCTQKNHWMYWMKFYRKIHHFIWTIRHKPHCIYFIIGTVAMIKTHCLYIHIPVYYMSWIQEKSSCHDHLNLAISGFWIHGIDKNKNANSLEFFQHN